MPVSTAGIWRVLAVASLAVCTAAAAPIAGGQWTDLDWHAITRPMERLPAWLVISAIIFAAAAISSTVGFAFSAIAGAILLHYVPDGLEAVQIMLVASIGNQVYAVAGLSRAISWSRSLPFILGGVATLPVGVLLVRALDPGAYIPAIGGALVAYGLYMLLRRPVVLQGRHRVAEVLVGAIGGITGPLAAFPGAVVTIWCGLRGWDKVTQRAVYQPYILVMQVLAFAALWLLQRRGASDPMLLAYAVPGVAGAVIGLRIFNALSEAQFRRVINGALVVSGLALVLK